MTLFSSPTHAPAPRKDTALPRHHPIASAPARTPSFMPERNTDMARSLGNAGMRHIGLAPSSAFIQNQFRTNAGEHHAPLPQKQTALQRSPDDEDAPSAAPQYNFPPVSGPFPPVPMPGISALNLYDGLSPLMAGAIASTTIDGFQTGKADISEANKKKLIEHARHIIEILKRFPGSEVIITGHTDAVDTEDLNITLGQQRAEATAAVLKTAGVPADAIKTQSKGESELLINTRRAESRNRRAEVRFKPFVSNLRFPGLQLDLTPPISPNAPAPSGNLFPPNVWVPPTTPNLLFQIPPAPQIPRNWLEEGLKRDKLVRSLPKWMQDKVVDGLKDGDEMIADKVIDALPIDDKKKAAIKAIAKSLLQMAKGKKFTAPSPPPRGMDPTIPPFPGFPKMPGEVIIPGPTFRF